MKRFFTLSLALVSLLWGRNAEAQQTLAHPDSVLLSTTVEGADEVRRYQVSTPMEADYALHYAISSAALNPKMGENPGELDDLAALMAHFRDTLHQVEQIHITGYASPDGPETLNSQLAKQRAENMKSYVSSHFKSSCSCPVVLDSAIAPWSAVREQLAASSVEGRDEALKILDSNHTPAQKQAALKAMPQVWSFLAHEVLPPLRRAEVDVSYKQCDVVTTRVAMASKPTPTSAPTIQSTPCPAPKSATKPVVTAQQTKPQDPCCEELLMSETVGIIVAMPGSAVDY